MVRPFVATPLYWNTVADFFCSKGGHQRMDAVPRWLALRWQHGAHWIPDNAGHAVVTAAVTAWRRLAVTLLVYDRGLVLHECYCAGVVRVFVDCICCTGCEVDHHVFIDGLWWVEQHVFTDSLWWVWSHVRVDRWCVEHHVFIARLWWVEHHVFYRAFIRTLQWQQCSVYLSTRDLWAFMIWRHRDLQTTDSDCIRIPQWGYWNGIFSFSIEKSPYIRSMSGVAQVTFCVATGRFAVHPVCL